jgi:CheY-like chemotaxis protein
VPAETKTPFRYCQSCGEQVYTYYTVVKYGAMEVRCSSCGFALGTEESHPLRSVDCILIADDDRFFRSLLGDLLVERGFTAKVIACESGTTFLTLATERLLQGLPNKVAILDILMEPLDGIATAVAYRAVEKALKVVRPTPLLFLSAVRYNENLKKAISHCQPALYLNKGSDATPDKLGPRLERVLGHLLQQGGS